MNQIEFLNGLSLILKSTKPGYSFVQEYADWVYDQKEDFNISHVITFWRLEKDDIHQDFLYFGGGNELVIEGIDLSGMVQENQTIDTNQNDFSKFKGKNFWTESHIISFPIPGIMTPFYNLKGILVFIAKEGDINLSFEQLLLIESLLGNTHPKDMSHPSVMECNRILTNNITTSFVINSTNPEYNQLYNSIVEAIDALSGKLSRNDLGLKHYSQWEILNEETKPIALSKIFNHNAYSSDIHHNTHLHISKSDEHYLKPIVSEFYKDIDKNYDLEFLPLVQAKASFKDNNYFNKLGLTPENSTIIIFLEKERDTFSSIQGYVSCYYVKDFPYTVFTSPDLIIGITQLIYKTIIRVGSYLNLKLLYCFTIDFNESANDRDKFFKKISQLLANWNGADECLIYQRQQDGHYQNMLNLENDCIDCEGINSLDLPKRLTKDGEFADFIKRISHNQGRPDLSETCNLYFNDESKYVKSAMVLSSYLSSELVKNILIFINRRPQKAMNGTLFNHAFSYYCSLQTCLCGIFLYHYNLLLQSLDSKNYLLKKFRHEIPSCTDAIKASIKEIKESISTERFITKANLVNILNMMDLNNERVSLLAKFFSASEFDDTYFARNKQDMSFKTFMNSYIDKFRTEAMYRGVDVYFDCRDQDNNPIKDIILHVSNYFMLSLTNVIINAIRYSAPGTCINAIAYEDKIEITDIGIPIRDSEKDKIFNEGFRGTDARQTSEKGMGYGLYLTKRVIEAHKGRIEVDSIPISSTNHYLERAVYNYYLSLNNDKKSQFVYFDVKEFEYPQIHSILTQIKNSEEINLDKTYLNNKIEVIKKWVEYNMEFGMPFILYPETFFDKEINKVKFTITLN